VIYISKGVNVFPISASVLGRYENKVYLNNQELYLDLNLISDAGIAIIEDGNKVLQFNLVI